MVTIAKEIKPRLFQLQRYFGLIIKFQSSGILPYNSSSTSDMVINGHVKRVNVFINLISICN